MESSSQCSVRKQCGNPNEEINLPFLLIHLEPLGSSCGYPTSKHRNCAVEGHIFLGYSLN
jgi:hypothetical protein